MPRELGRKGGVVTTATGEGLGRYNTEPELRGEQGTSFHLPIFQFLLARRR